MVRICDGRMSGTGFGTVVLHVTPEAAVGGPLALVRTGDEIALDVPGRSLSRRRVRRRAGARRAAVAAARARVGPSGYVWLYREFVQGADQGADFVLPARLARVRRPPRLALNPMRSPKHTDEEARR